MKDFAERIIAARKHLLPADHLRGQAKPAEEGGCGVVGFATSVPVSGRHIFEPSVQMHNRGNGKGGGIAVAGFNADQLGVDARTLRENYIVQIALLEPKIAGRLEKEFIEPQFQVKHKTKVSPRMDHREVGLEVRPPDLVRYFVRPKKAVLRRFAHENNLSGVTGRALEDEFVFQNSYRINQKYYASLGEKQAFVLSHARDLMIFKIVGYAEQVVQYYGLDDLKGCVWIAHQRYPTKGRVWHPAGAHPFIGMNEALVHNGDFANYFSICEYLRQHNLESQFLTDTEVSVLLFDLWNRVYKYPLEYVIEAMAPTADLDFDRLPPDKRKIYRAIQARQMHGSPDGPWFFIIARSDPDNGSHQLLGITDTSMLRPQVFAIQEGDVSIGVVGSEKQAIDAILHSLNEEDPRFRKVADRYWNARGGSHTDGGAFSFTVERKKNKGRVVCSDKFGKEIKPPPGEWKIDLQSKPRPPKGADALDKTLLACADGRDGGAAFTKLTAVIAESRTLNVRWMVDRLVGMARQDPARFDWVMDVLTRLSNRQYSCGGIKRSVVQELVRDGINDVLCGVPLLAAKKASPVRRVDWRSRRTVRKPTEDETTLVICAEGFEPEGDDCDSRLLVEAYELGWQRFIVYGLRGQRFTGCGLGPDTGDVRIDVYGSSGDYLASGIDGAEIHVHDNGQDQLAQIMKAGRLVVYGDVGQAFMYGAKGGEVYVMKNAAGRPLINAAGGPRVVINGTCLDFLAESFMAGDPHDGGGFVILNGMAFDDDGQLREQETPYPGCNLFSLASGGAIFVRDPYNKVVPGQLNGGQLAELTEEDWRLMLPYLEKNEELFGISVEHDLLTVNGARQPPEEVYRKVLPVGLSVLAKQEVPE